MSIQLLLYVHHDPVQKKLSLAPYSADKKNIALSLRDWLRSPYPQTTKNFLSSLFEDELSFRSLEGKRRNSEQEKPFSFFRLRSSTAIQRIQEASRIGTLFFEEKPVLFDPITRITFSLRLNQETMSFEGLKGKILLNPPHLFYDKGILRIVPEELTGDLLQLLLKNSLSSTDLKMVHSLYEELPKGILTLEFPSSITSKPILLPKVIVQFLDPQYLFCCVRFVYPSGTTHAYPIDILSPKETERNASFEEQTARDIQDIGFIWEHNSQQFRLHPDIRDEAILFLLEWVWKVEDWSGKTVLSCQNYSLQPMIESNRIALKSTISFGNKNVSLPEVLYSLEKEKKSVSLGPQEVGFLDTTHFSSLKPLLREVSILSDTVSLPKNKIGLLDTYQATLPTIPRVREDDIPSCTFEGTLRPYQEEGVSWMKNLYERMFSGILADEMGLGKTVQVLAYIARSKAQLPTLIIAPAAVLENWKREIQRFCPLLSSCIVRGLQECCTSHDIVLTSYATARMCPSKFQTRTWGLLVLDEAQNVKNSETKTHEALRSLSTSMKLFLTGTPLENSIQDLFSLFRLLDHDLLSQQDPLPLIKQKIKPFILKRTKKEVAQDLPPLIEEISWISLYEEEKHRYETFVNALRNGTLKKIPLDRAHPSQVAILEGLLRMRQLVCHPLLFQAEYEGETSSLPSAKWDMSLSDIRELIQEGKKVLFFSQFVEILHLFSHQLREENISHYSIDGGTKNRQEVIDRFEKSETPCVLLASLKATGVGVNITAADCILLYDPWWNSAVEKQAIARAHRIGRKEPVYVKRYITLHTIEERVYELTQKKEKLLETVLSQEASFEDNSSLEALLFED